MNYRGPVKSFLLSCLRSVFIWLVQQKAGSDHLEVERKFALRQGDSDTIPLRMRELGFEPVGTAHMRDCFLPVLVKGEMMRIRDESFGPKTESILTLKTWVDTGQGDRERKETERKVSSLLRTLLIIAAKTTVGKELLSFAKERVLFEAKVGGKTAVVSLDRVSGLGKYSGDYLEIEFICSLGEDISSVQREIFSLSERIFQEKREEVRRSYFEMLELSLV